MDPHLAVDRLIESELRHSLRCKRFRVFVSETGTSPREASLQAVDFEWLRLPCGKCVAPRAGAVPLPPVHSQELHRHVEGVLEELQGLDAEVPENISRVGAAAAADMHVERCFVFTAPLRSEPGLAPVLPWLVKFISARARDMLALDAPSFTCACAMHHLLFNEDLCAAWQTGAVEMAAEAAAAALSSLLFAPPPLAIEAHVRVRTASRWLSLLNVARLHALLPAASQVVAAWAREAVRAALSRGSPETRVWSALLLCALGAADAELSRAIGSAAFTEATAMLHEDMLSMRNVYA